MPWPPASCGGWCSWPRPCCPTTRRRPWLSGATSPSAAWPCCWPGPIAAAWQRCALPVVIAVCANWHDRSLPWARLMPSLGLIAGGIACVNQSEMARLGGGEGHAYLLGAALTVVAVAAWTWYPIRNARWLKAHPGLSATTWTTAQGLTTLPLAALGWLAWGLWQGRLPGHNWWMGLGAQPGYFVGLMLAMGLFASWAGTLAWSRASKLLPTSLTGQLIVFETLSALAYGFLHRGQWPGWLTGAGIALLMGGVMMGVRAFQRPAPH